MHARLQQAHGLHTSPKREGSLAKVAKEELTLTEHLSNELAGLRKPFAKQAVAVDFDQLAMGVSAAFEVSKQATSMRHGARTGQRSALSASAPRPCTATSCRYLEGRAIG